MTMFPPPTLHPEPTDVTREIERGGLLWVDPADRGSPRSAWYDPSALPGEPHFRSTASALRLVRSRAHRDSSQRPTRRRGRSRQSLDAVAIAQAQGFTDAHGEAITARYEPGRTDDATRRQIQELVEQVAELRRRLNRKSRNGR